MNGCGTLVEKNCQRKTTLGPLGEKSVCQVEGLPGCTPSIPIEILKNANFLDALMCNIIHDLPFSLNQPLKSADDWYIGVLKNKVRKLKMW